VGFFKSTFGKIATAVNPVALGANLLSGGLDYIASEADRRSNEALNAQQNQLARDQMAMQKEFAQQGIRWRVADAEAAGLHPLAALGAMPTNASGVSASAVPTGSGNRFRALSEMGQNLSRAVLANSDKVSRDVVDANRRMALAQAKDMENQAMLSEIAVNRARNPSPLLLNKRLNKPILTS